MFSLPDNDTEAVFSNEEINLEETADVMERILHGLISTQYDPNFLSSPTLRQLHAAVKAHDKYDIEINRLKATLAFKSALKNDPWAGLAYASHINDLTLGRHAIELLQFDKIEKDGTGFWGMMADVKPSWQIALARLILPEIAFAFPELCHADFLDAMTD
jgi:hypothetical protein